MTHCDCVNICSRWGLYDDGSGGWFCPYIPDSNNVCKKTIDSGKDIQPSIIKKEKLNNELLSIRFK